MEGRRKPLYILRRPISWRRKRTSAEIACAEPAWNLARAYRLLGDEEKEKEFLTKALQGFRNNYAPEHPKRLAAEKREQELNEKRD